MIALEGGTAETVLMGVLGLALLFGVAVFAVAILYVLREVHRQQEWREANTKRARAAGPKPGPTRRAEERKLIRARMINLQADIAAGRVAHMPERQTQKAS